MDAALLERRRSGIGGSDVAAICGLSPWKSAYQVWMEKTGRSEGPEQNHAMAYGTMIEPVIRSWYELETGSPVIMPRGILVHPVHNFMLANLDGHTSDRVLEIKTSRSNSDWGEPGTDAIPVYYMTQLQWYMMIAGFELGDVAVSFAGTMPCIYTVESDPEIQELLIEKTTEFWDLVKTDTPPPPTTLQDMLVAYPRSQGVSVTASQDVEQLVAKLKVIKDGIKQAEAKEEAIKAEIMKAMGTADTLTDLQGKPIATWKSAKASTTFDSKAFQATHPDLYKQFTIEKPASRRFLVK